MKVTFSKDCEETFWAINNEYPYQIDAVEGIALVQCVMDYLSKHVQVVHERGEPILVDRSIMDNAAIYYNQDEIRFDNIPDSIRLTSKEPPYEEFHDDAT